MSEYFTGGLEKKEFDTYKALLSLKRATVLELAKISGEKRSNLYRILETLLEKRLVSEVYEKKKHYYIAESPRTLVDFINRQREKVQEILPELESLEKEAVERPKVKFYEGKTGIRVLYDELLEERKELLAFAWPDKLLAAVEFHDEFVRQRAKRGMRARVILPDTKFSRKRNTPLREARYSKYMKSFDSTFMVSGNKVVAFSLKRWITGVLVENKEIAEGMRAFFDALWEELEEPKDLKRK